MRFSSSVVFALRALSFSAFAMLAAVGCSVESVDEVDPNEDLPSDTESNATTPVVYRSTAGANATSATSISVTKPAGTLSGDVLLARVANRNQVGANVTPPSGWTFLRSDQSASQLKTWVYFKVAGSSEPASYAFGISIASNVSVSVSAFSGADPTNPIDTSTGQKNGTSSSLAAPAITTSTASGLAVWFGTQLWAGSACPSSPLVPPSGFSEPSDTCLVSTSAGILYDVAYKTLGAPGAQPAFNGSSPFANTNTVQVIALRAKGTTTTPPSTTCTVGNSFSSTVTTVGQLTATAIVEASGLAASRVNANVLYVHGEDNASFVAMNKTNAAVVGTYKAGVVPWDWEDIATGPCPAGSCIFMGDIGKASGHPPPSPTVFAVYRMKEPSIASGQTSGTITGDRFPFQYPAADRAQNAEALMVHPTSGDIYVVTKNDATGLSKAYKMPKPLPAPGTLSTLVFVANLQIPLGADSTYRAVTAGAIHPCSNRFLLRTYRKVYEYRGTTGGSFESAFAAAPVALTDTVEGQGEAIEYEPNGGGYFTMSERAAAPYALKRVARN